MAYGTLTISCLIFTINIFKVINANTIYDKNGLGIISGHPINITQVPFMAAYEGECGASIVHEQFLVTACHCLRYLGVEGKAAYVGTDNRHDGEKYEIEKGFCHPNYKCHSFVKHENDDFDIAVLKLKQKLTLNDKVNIIKMADSSVALKKGDVFETIGFGFTHIKPIRPTNVLLAVNVSFVEHDDCLKALGDEFEITERIICAGGGDPYHGPCWGDSGGALLFNGLLLGIVSFGPDCQPNKPAGFTSVPAMKDFIDKTIKENL